MGGKRSAYLISSLFDHVFGGAVYTPPKTIYVGLWTEAVDSKATGTTPGEVKAADYKRLAIPNTAKYWPKAVVGMKQLGESVRFRDAKGEWGTVKFVLLLDEEKGGNLLYWMPLKNPRIVQEDDAVEFPPGGLKMLET